MPLIDMRRSACTSTSPSSTAGSTPGSTPPPACPSISTTCAPRRADSWWRFHGEPIGCGALKAHGDQPIEDQAHVGRPTCPRPRRWSPAAGRAGAPRRRRRPHAVHLDTNRALTEAIAMYRSAGYREVDAFNDEPYAHHWFEKRLDAPLVAGSGAVPVVVDADRSPATLTIRNAQDASSPSEAGVGSLRRTRGRAPAPGRPPARWTPPRPRAVTAGSEARGRSRAGPGRRRRRMPRGCHR